MAEEDDLSSISFVSSISLASSIHQPKPPGGPKPSSQGFARSSKAIGKVVRSPYLVTSTPYPVKRPRLNSTSSRHNGVGPGHHGNRSVPVVWTSPPSQGQRASVPRPSVSHFLQSLMKTPGFSAVVTPTDPRRRKHSHLHSSQQPPSNKPGSEMVVSGDLDAIQLRDLVVQLKRDMNAVRKERDLAKAQQVRLSKELLKKDKDIEDLISNGHISTRDATRSLAKTSGQDKSSSQTGGGVVLVSSLRQQVHSLERALREKEGQVTELQRGVAASRLREAEVQAETYYREICRLRQVFGCDADEGGVTLQQTLQETRVKFGALQQATVTMATQIETLEQENRSLKEKTDMLQCESVIGQQGAITDHYQDYSRAQMLSALAQLEMRCVELEKKADSVLKDKDKARVLYEQRIGELRTQASQANSRALSLESQLTSCRSKEEKLKNVIRRLKEDRTHYRQAAEHTQTELQGVQDRLGKEELSKEEITKQLQVVQQDYCNEMMAIEHSRKLARKQSSLLPASKGRRETAASTIQHNWRRRQTMTKQERYQRETEEAIVDLQSTFKAHLARKKAVSLQATPLAPPPVPVTPEEVVSSSDEGEDSSEAIELVQSALRGYLTRKMTLQDLTQKSNSGDESLLVTENGLDEADLGRDDHVTSGHGIVPTSSLVGYTPPPHTPKHNSLSTSLPSRGTASGKLNKSPWYPLPDYEDSGSDQDYQHVRVRSYLSTSSESVQDPDKCLLMDEL